MLHGVILKHKLDCMSNRVIECYRIILSHKSPTGYGNNASVACYAIITHLARLC